MESNSNGNINTGLTSAEAVEKLKTAGFNELPSAKPKTIWRIALEVIKEPMFILLIGCATLYMILGDYKEGVVMLSAVLIIIGITFYQSRKTERALDALKQLSSPRALVIRDGKEMRIPGREVVPDDILILHEGDRIPADGNIIDTTHLVVDESLLTGESVPVNKSENGSLSKVFSGTLVVQGKALVKVKSTGFSTEFGKIGKSLQSITEDQTRLQREMKILIRTLIIAGIFLSVAVVILYFITRGNFLQALLNGLAASMAILPEEFPVVLTVFLALGAWRLSKKNVLTRKPSAIETLGSATVLCTDKTGTITLNKMEVAAIGAVGQIIGKNEFNNHPQVVQGILQLAHLASVHNSIDPMEKAISNALVDKQHASYKLIKAYPISASLLAMTHVHGEGEIIETIAAKGAPEAIFDLCHLSESEREKFDRELEKMASMGFRILAVAKAEATSKTLPDIQHDFNYSFVGFIGFEDPIRPEVPAAIQECHQAGVKVIMITGDYPSTASNIGRQIQLPGYDSVITGEQLNALSDDELKLKIKDVSIFARVVPDQKLRIVNALKANNEIVAMTGDGVNDAPALKAAHIGIAMGNKGTDVAREASSLVLLDDNFASIVNAIRLGRKIFDNLQKAMSYILAIHMPIIGLTLLPSFITSLPLMLLPLHIIFMELIIDPVCSVAFEWEKEEKGIMNRPPRSIHHKFFGGKKILASIGQGLLLLLAVLGVYFFSIYEGHTEGEVRAIAFSSLIIGNLFLILTKLSKTRSFFAVLFEKNIPLYIIVAVAFGLLMMVISVPGLTDLFGFEFPGFYHFIPSVIAAASVLVIMEIIKLINLAVRKRQTISH